MPSVCHVVLTAWKLRCCHLVNCYFLTNTSAPSSLMLRICYKRSAAVTTFYTLCSIFSFRYMFIWIFRSHSLTQFLQLFAYNSNLLLRVLPLLNLTYFPSYINSYIYLQDQLGVDSALAFQLAALALQASYGDYVDTSLTHSQLKKSSLLPTSVLHDHPSLLYWSVFL